MTPEDEKSIDELSESGRAWRTWFDRVGEVATPEVINATANLAITEREIYSGVGRVKVLERIAFLTNKYLGIGCCDDHHTQLWNELLNELSKFEDDTFAKLKTEQPQENKQ